MLTIAWTCNFRILNKTLDNNVYKSLDSKSLFSGVSESRSDFLQHYYHANPSTHSIVRKPWHLADISQWSEFFDICSTEPYNIDLATSFMKVLSLTRAGMTKRVSSQEWLSRWLWVISADFRWRGVFFRCQKEGGWGLAKIFHDEEI